VKTRTPDEIREAKSRITIPSFWKLVAMANESPNESIAQVRTPEAEIASKREKLSNLYQD
jgi:DNA/RNA endonuclease G (NUC1)